MERDAVLGPKGNGAIGPLSRLMREGKTEGQRQRAMNVLGYLGEEAFEPLFSAAADPTDPTARGLAVLMIGDRVALGTNRARAVAFLVRCVDETNNVAAVAADALGTLRPDPSLVVPALVGGLERGDRWVRYSAATALGKFGGRARSAAPALAEALVDNDLGVRRAATNALSVVAPEMLAWPEDREVHTD